MPSAVTTKVSTLYSGSTYGDSTVVVYQQHFLKLSSLTSLGTSDVVNEELLASFSLELLTVNLNDCVHLFIYYLTGLTAGRNHLVIRFFEPQRHKSGAKLALFCEMCKKKCANLLFV